MVRCRLYECEESDVPSNISWAFKLSSELDLNNRTFYFSAPTQTDMGVRVTYSFEDTASSVTTKTHAYESLVASEVVSDHTVLLAVHIFLHK